MATFIVIFFSAVSIFSIIYANEKSNRKIVMIGIGGSLAIVGIVALVLLSVSSNNNIFKNSAKAIVQFVSGNNDRLTQKEIDHYSTLLSEILPTKSGWIYNPDDFSTGKAYQGQFDIPIGKNMEYAAFHGASDTEEITIKNYVFTSDYEPKGQAKLRIAPDGKVILDYIVYYIAIGEDTGNFGVRIE